MPGSAKGLTGMISFMQLTCKPAFHRGKVFSPVEPKHSKTPGEEIRPIIDEVGVEFERLLHMGGVAEALKRV